VAAGVSGAVTRPEDREVGGCSMTSVSGVGSSVWRSRELQGHDRLDVVGLGEQIDGLNGGDVVAEGA
jgi:hypothetical protein